MTVWSVKNLRVAYETRTVLWDVSFEIPAGLMVAIVGPNGAGKSTLLKAVMGLLKPLMGEVSFFDQSVHAVKDKISYVPQRASVDWDFPICAEELVLMGRYGALGMWGRPRQADREAARRALERVGMVPFARRQIGQLSGGQQQRLFVARALVKNPTLYLMDEPFAGIDLTTEKELMGLFREERSQRKTLVVVHHDLPSVEEYFDWVIILSTRLIAVGPVREVFTRDNLAQAFGHQASLLNEAASLSARQVSGLL